MSALRRYLAGASLFIIFLSVIPLVDINAQEDEEETSSTLIDPRRRGTTGTAAPTDTSGGGASPSTILGTSDDSGYTGTSPAPDDVHFIPLAGIPGVTGEGDDSPRSLIGYINALFRFAIGLAALLAVIRIVLAGIKYMATDAFSTKEEAKKDITGALLGLLIILSTVVILRLIYPGILNLNVLEGVTPVDILPEFGRSIPTERFTAADATPEEIAATFLDEFSERCEAVGGDPVLRAPSLGDSILYSIRSIFTSEDISDEQYVDLVCYSNVTFEGGRSLSEPSPEELTELFGADAGAQDPYFAVEFPYNPSMNGPQEQRARQRCNDDVGFLDGEFHETRDEASDTVRFYCTYTSQVPDSP